jgi:hypothetical protein
MRRRRLATIAVLLVAIAAIAAGCGSDSSSSSSTPAPTPGQSKASVYNDPALFILGEAALPGGYVLDPSNTGAITNADSVKGRGDAYRRNVASWGRISGYGTGWRPDSADIQGPLQIQSFASTYETEGGAIDAFAQGITELEQAWTMVDSSVKVGDEVRFATRDLDSTAGPITLYMVAWRSGQVHGTLALTWERDRGSLDEAIAYAEKQQERIEQSIRDGIPTE